MPTVEHIAPAVSMRSKRTSNISLPDRTSPSEVTVTAARRNTITEENISRTKKKPKAPFTPTIPEDDSTEKIDEAPSFRIEEETKKLNRKSSNASRISRVGSISTKVSHSYENRAFDGNMKPTESKNSSIRSPSRAPSEQSLEIYREQYCCCTRRTKCEKLLLAIVTVLLIIVVVLAVVIAFLATNKKSISTLFKLNIG